MPLVQCPVTEAGNGQRVRIEHGKHCVVSAEKRPACSLPEAAFSTEERADGLHIVDVATGHSWGIASTQAIADGQIAAMERMSR